MSSHDGFRSSVLRGLSGGPSNVAKVSAKVTRSSPRAGAAGENVGACGERSPRCVDNGDGCVKEGDPFELRVVCEDVCEDGRKLAEGVCEDGRDNVDGCAKEGGPFGKEGDPFELRVVVRGRVCEDGRKLRVFSTSAAILFRCTNAMSSVILGMLWLVEPNDSHGSRPWSQSGS